MISCKF